MIIAWEPTGMVSAGTGALKSFLPGKLHTLNFYTNLVKSAVCAEKIQACQLDLKAAGRQRNERCTPLLSLSPTPLHVCSHVCFCLPLCALENPLWTRNTLNSFQKGWVGFNKTTYDYLKERRICGVLHVIWNLINCSTGGDNNNNSIFIIRIHCGQLIHILFLKFLYYPKKTSELKIYCILVSILLIPSDFWFSVASFHHADSWISLTPTRISRVICLVHLPCEDLTWISQITVSWHI